MSHEVAERVGRHVRASQRRREAVPQRVGMNARVAERDLHEPKARTHAADAREQRPSWPREIHYRPQLLRERGGDRQLARAGLAAHVEPTVREVHVFAHEPAKLGAPHAREERHLDQQREPLAPELAQPRRVLADLVWMQDVAPLPLDLRSLDLAHGVVREMPALDREREHAPEHGQVFHDRRRLHAGRDPLTDPCLDVARAHAVQERVTGPTLDDHGVRPSVALDRGLAPRTRAQVRHDGGVALLQRERRAVDLLALVGAQVGRGELRRRVDGAVVAPFVSLNDRAESRPVRVDVRRQTTFSAGLWHGFGQAKLPARPDRISTAVRYCVWAPGPLSVVSAEPGASFVSGTYARGSLAADGAKTWRAGLVMPKCCHAVLPGQGGKGERATGAAVCSEGGVLSSKKAPAFQFYARDWLSSTRVRALSREARGDYINLLAFAWTNGGIPADAVSRARMLGLTKRQEAACWRELSQFFHPHPKDKALLVNDRLETERGEFDKYCARQRERGLRGNEAKRERQRERDGERTGERTGERLGDAKDVQRTGDAKALRTPEERSASSTASASSSASSERSFSGVGTPTRTREPRLADGSRPCTNEEWAEAMRLLDVHAVEAGSGAALDDIGPVYGEGAT